MNGNMVYDFLTDKNGKEFYQTIQKFINEAQADYNIILSYMGDDTDDTLKWISSFMMSKNIRDEAIRLKAS